MGIYFEKILKIERFKTLFEGNYKSPYNFTGEFHPFWEAVYVTEGEVNVSGDERVYTLSRGDIIFHKPMEFHRLWSRKNKDIHVIIISFQATGSLLSQFEGRVLSLDDSSLLLMEQFIAFLKESFDDKTGNFAKAMRKGGQAAAGKIQIAINLFENFMISLPNHTLAPTKREKENVSETYRQILTELSANVCGWITIPELANKCNFSPAQIKRVFAKYSDIGIHKYFIKLKVAEAIKMLGDGKDIAEISRALSFSGQNYFSCVFKRETGYSPTAYREKLLLTEDTKNDRAKKV